jgi:small-conductance mechanosensitive channel
MNIIIGTLCISLSVFAYCIVLLGVRDPRKPWWAADMLVGNCYILIIMGLGLGGLLAIGATVVTWKTAGAGIWHVLIAAALMAATVAGVKSMRIKERLARLENLASAEAQAPPLTVKDPGGKGHRPDTPKMAA